MPTKKPTKYEYLFIVQGRYFGRWEDETAEEDYREAKKRLKEYRANIPEYAHRIIQRRELR